MKNLHTVALASFLIALAVSPALAGGKKPAKPKAPAKPLDAFTMFDINERDNAKTAYAKGNKLLAPFDTNHDGKLDDAEVSHILPGGKPPK